VLKRELYEQSGVLHYWVADPATRTITVWDLVDGRYVEAHVVRDGHPVTIVAPVSIALTTEAVFGPA
jgi:Uma2 family endonuclease